MAFKNFEKVAFRNFENLRRKYHGGPLLSRNFGYRVENKTFSLHAQKRKLLSVYDTPAQSAGKSFTGNGI